MKRKTLLLSLSIAGLGASAAAFQNSGFGGHDDAHKAAIFHALTQGPTADSGPCGRQAWVARKAAALQALSEREQVRSRKPMPAPGRFRVIAPTRA